MSKREETNPTATAAPELYRAGTFLIARDPAQVRNRKEIMADGHRWYRFMDAIFCPAPVFSLVPEQVRELCELRLALRGQILDEAVHDDVTAAVLGACRSSSGTTPHAILDFGTGDGRLLPRLAAQYPTSMIAGIDISLASLYQSQHTGQLLLVAPHGPLPLRDASVDLIVALFVLHFAVPARMLTELHRVATPDARIIANVYGLAVDSALRRLEGAGWHISDLQPVPGRAGHAILVADRTVCGDRWCER